MSEINYNFGEEDINDIFIKVLIKELRQYLAMEESLE